MSFYRNQKKKSQTNNNRTEDFGITRKVSLLLEYTLHQSSKKNIKLYRNTVYQQLIKVNVEISKAITYANCSKDYINERIKYQNRVIANCDVMNMLINSIYSIHIIDSHTCETWSKLVSDVKYMTIAWLKTTKAERNN